MSEKISRSEAFGIAAILSLATWLRLRDGAFLAFNRDAGLLVSMADRLRAGEAILLGIPSSKGIVNPPLPVYLVAALETISQSPRAITMMMGLLQVAAIAITWLALRRRVGVWTALSTATLFATSAWAVLYARILWPPCFAPIFSIAMLVALWACTIERKPWALPAALALAAVVSQLHLTGFAWFALIVAVAILFRPPIAPRPLVAGVLAVVLLYLPFAIGLATQGIAAGTKRRALFVDFIGSPARFYLLSPLHAGIDYHFPTVDAELPAASLFTLLAWIAAGLVLAGFVLSAPRPRELERTPELPFVRSSADPRLAIPFLFVLVPVGAMCAAGLDTSAHYLILQYPTAWLFLVLAVDRLPVPRAGRTAIVGIFAASGIAWTLLLQGWIETRPQWNWSAGYSTALGDQEAAIAWISQDAGADEVQLIATPFNPAAKVPANLTLLIARHRWRPHAGELVFDVVRIRYLVVDETNGGLSGAARARLAALGAKRFGAIWVCRWD